MEQAATSTSSPLASPTEDEIAVAEILLNLKTMMLPLSESLPDCNWGCRRKRSCLVSPPSINTIEHRKTPTTRTTASPDTPLIFSATESDDKPKHSSKKNKSKGREDYLDLIEEETKRKKLLRGEIANVKKYYDKLKETNRRLRAMKQEAMTKCGSVKSGEPRGFDLNLPAEEESGGVVIYWPLDDDKRARSAEARRKRIRIIKSKSTRK
ncbi:uncharacterized protein LOC125223672 [Salvia hispanica]|uniref:uncharacterized protein LOC125223672 n=1 Tax=Salvia hispanica TaxID=49212 RepID=UPI002009601A|nr:uncharacterized protein LOC125223672 [Salvia hispanica]